MRRHLIQNLIRSIALLTVLWTYGCMANVTRYIPATPLQPPFANITKNIRDRRIAVMIFDSRDTRVEGGHHEGSLQVRQPWTFGLSKEDREVLYGKAGEVAALSFAVELERQGLSITPYSDWNPDYAKLNDLLLSGKVERVVLNTYGQGTIEGFGSAGNYWEATVYFSDIKLKETGSDRVIWEGELKSYAKLDNSPAKLDWNILTVVTKSLNGALKLQKIQAAANPLDAMSSTSSYINNWEATYNLERTDITPIEVAARHAVIQFLSEVQEKLH